MFEQWEIVQKFDGRTYGEMLRTLLPRGFAWRFSRVFSFVEEVQNTSTSADVYADTTDAAEVWVATSQAAGASGGRFARLLSCFGEELTRLEARALALLNQTDPGVATELLEDWERVLGLSSQCVASLEQTEEERRAQAHEKLWGRVHTFTAQRVVDVAATLGFGVTVDEVPVLGEPRIIGVARMGVQRMGGRGGYSVLRVTINSATTDEAVLKCALREFVPAHVVIVYA